VRYIKFGIGVVLLASLCMGAYAQIQPDERLFEEAKVLIFDKKWETAQEKLENLLDRYPQSLMKEQALFYRAKCLSERTGREKEAIEAYDSYIREVKNPEKNASLMEDSEISIIDLAYGLYEKGERRFLDAIEERLGRPNKVVSYYAAFKLSYVKDKTVSSRAVPVLKRIIESEQDAELKDRAKIALLRVDPGALKAVGDGQSKAHARILKIQVVEGGKKKLDINIPWALADLALQAIPDEEKSVMRKKGYDLDKIINELAKTKSSIIEINENGSVIKIWIE
jgi:tetratricopeptide (TPR) repeat protein